MLEEYGITHITEDGHIFAGDHEMKQSIAVKKGKYKLQQPYARVTFSDKTKKLYYTNKKGKEYWTYAPICILVSRAIYAWYHGEVPAGYEIDHIDNDTSNNHLHNLRLLTKDENLARKRVSRNQYNCNKTDEEILAERANRKYVYDRAQHKAVQADWWIKEKTEKQINRAAEQAKEKALKTIWHSLTAKIKEKKAERAAIDKTVDIETWRKLGIEIDILQMALIETRKKLRK